MLGNLFNDDTGAFVLNYDKDGNYQDNFTADEVFPVLFDVAEPAARKAILARLLGADFVTPVGLRTISTADAGIFRRTVSACSAASGPTSRCGSRSRWRATARRRGGALARSDLRARWKAGAARNTVPGQFGEWFDGGSLTNRGMYLSPWTGAKYLWAVAETVCGIDGYRTSGRPHLAPLRARRTGSGPRPRACTGAAGAAPT